MKDTREVTNSSQKRAGNSWPAYCFDAANSGHASSNIGPVGDIDLKWKQSVTGCRGPTVVDERIYAGGRRAVYALSIKDGGKLWDHSVTGNPSPVTVSEDGVLVSHGGDAITALARDGSEKWTKSFDGEYANPTSATVSDGSAYVGLSNKGVIYSLTTTDGSVEWTFETGNNQEISSLPAVQNGTVYVPSDDHRLYAVSAADGTEQWRFDAEYKDGQGYDPCPPTVVDKTVYVGGNDDTIHALRTTDGSQKWSFETEGYIRSSPTVGNGTVYCGSRDGTMYALAVESGEEEWTFSTDKDIVSAPALVNGILYFGSNDGNMYAVNAESGEEVWTYRLGDPVFSSPAVSGSDVFIGTFRGDLYALSGKTPERSRTATTTPSRTSSPQTNDEVRTTSQSKRYSLSEANRQQTVSIGDKTYQVLWDIPEADPNRRAVVTQSYELVDPATAKDALITDTWSGGRRNVDWQSVLEHAKRDKQKWQILESLNRTADLSTEVAAAVGLTSLGVGPALPVALDALESSIVWGQNTIDDPYTEQYSKMAEAAGTIKWVNNETNDINSAVQLSEDAIAVTKLATEAANTVGDIKDVANVARVVGQVANSSGSVQVGLMAGGAMAKSIAYQMFVGLAASKVVSSATGLFEANARTAAAGAGHNTVRIPILQDLASLQQQAVAGTLSPPDIIRYHTYQMVQYQIAGAATSAMARYQDSVDESLLGSGLAMIFNSEEIATTAQQTSQRYSELAKYSIGVLGEGWRTALERHQESINTEIFGAGGGQ